jgi:putative ABC transport system permease protein
MTATTTLGTKLPVSALHPGDVLRVGAVGLLSRKLRAGLSALGIAIGIAAVVGVLGISESTKAQLLSALDQQGTNLLTVQGSGGITGGDGVLPVTTEPMISRIEPVLNVSSVAPTGASVRRTDAVSTERTNGLSVKAADPGLLTTLAGSVADGAWLDDARSQLPVVVLGSVAAQRLGITTVQDDSRIFIGGHWFTVVGILDSVQLAQDIDRSALIGRDIAASLLGADDAPGTVYVRTEPEQVDAVRSVLGATVDPDSPDRVQVSRPSDAIEARAAASTAFTGLFLSLGGVALLVGGVGIANVMVISVLERRSEIGVRRALGATRRHVSLQFLAEALLLSGIGGAGGVLIGGLAVAGYDLVRGWQVVIPVVGVVGGLFCALLIGGVAGLYPAARAARLSPTEALRTV